MTLSTSMRCLNLSGLSSRKELHATQLNQFQTFPIYFAKLRVFHPNFARILMKIFLPDRSVDYFMFDYFYLSSRGGLEVERPLHIQ